MDRRHLVIVAALALVSACEKKPAAAPPPPLPELVAKPTAVDVSRLSAPALFANVPADTPYMIAAFEAIPLEYYAKLKRAVGPALASAYQQLRTAAAEADDGPERLLLAIEQELDGKWDAKGLESLGFAASPRFAIYGLGVAPVVARIEVRDDKAVLATIERIAQRAQLTLPAVRTLDARKFWRLQNGRGDMAAIVALADNQLVAAVGRAADVDRNLALIIGSEKPRASMAGGQVLTEIMVKHSFGPHMIGFVDTRKMLTQGLAFAGQQPSSACTTEIDSLGTRVPRAVLGYSLLTTSVSSGGAVLELAPDLVTQLEGMRTEVPGLTEAMAGKPIFAFGIGIQLESARRLAIQAMTALSRLGYACDLPKLVDEAASATKTLSQGLPPSIASATGLVMALHEVTFTSSPVPEKIEGYAAITSTNAKTMFEQLVIQEPEIGKLGIKTDGHFHPVSGIGLPFPIHGGVGERAIVLTMGTEGKRLGESAIGARASGKAPFLLMSYDYGRFLDLQSEMSRLVSGATDPMMQLERELNDGLSKLFGRAAVSVDAGRHGLVFWGTIEMK